MLTDYTDSYVEKYALAVKFEVKYSRFAKGCKERFAQVIIVLGYNFVLGPACVSRILSNPSLDDRCLF